MNKNTKETLILASHLGSLFKHGFYNAQSDTALILGLAGMNFHAKYNPHWDIAYTKDFSYAKIWSPQHICQYCKLYNIDNIVLAYTEPLLSLEFATSIWEFACKDNINLYISTNGYFPYKTLFLLRNKIFMTTLQVNLHSVMDYFYRRLALVDVSIIKGFCRQAKKYKMPLSINSLIIEQENDNKKNLQKLAEFIYNLDPQTPWTLKAYSPEYKLLDKKKTCFSSMKNALQIGIDVGLTNVSII